MQRTVLNCATIEVANNRGMSGMATADEINRGLQIRKERSFWRIASSIILGSLTVAGLLVVVAPLAAPADNDEDSRHGREDNDKGIRAEITALQATVSALQNQVNTLQTANADLQKEITTLQTQLTAVQANHALALGPFVSVDPNPEIGVIGPNIIFSGANIHIVSGSGATDDNGNRTGLGNLIIGYDEDPGTSVGPVGPGEGHPPPFPLQPGDRSGSHNLVIGSWHKFTQAASGGFVAGEYNVIGSEGASVSGGGYNTVSGWVSSVSGGGFNTASGFEAIVTGGLDNTASGNYASVSGGDHNSASGFFDASVTGGQGNVASGFSGASVTGGSQNTAGGFGTVVIGGQNVTNNNNNSIAPQPPFP
jgi:hypothetical protein